MSHPSVHVRLSPKLRDALDELRRGQRDLPSAPEALRRALEQAIAASEAEAQVGDEPTAACAHHAVTNTKQTPRSQAAAPHEFELVLNPGSTTTQKGSATYDANSGSKSRRQT